MPGTIPAEFMNPLRAFGQGMPPTGIRIIDVYLDIIAVDMAARRVPPPGISPDHPQVSPDWADPEAAFIRGRADRNEIPRTPQPTGGELLDVTWAFNQATGARPEQWEIDETPANQRGVEGGRSLPLDPLTDQLVFPINARLPSLNRQPGIIFVPVGWFPILGTIHLFGGQQIIGVAATPHGSVLVKYGDGACIYTQNPNNFADDRHMTANQSILRLNRAGDPNQDPEVLRVRAIMARLDQGYDQALNTNVWDPGTPVEQRQPPWLADDAKRRETLRKVIMAPEFKGYSNVRIRSILIRQENWRSPAGNGVELQARAPVDDDLGNPFQPAAFSQHVGGLRPTAVFCTSVGIDLVSCGHTIVEDVVVTDFRMGIGIRCRPRAIPGGSQFAYLNQVRHCRVENCFVGIFLQQILASDYGGENATRLAQALGFDSGGPNSSVIFRCHVRAEHQEGSPVPRAGVELGGRTCHLTFSTLEMPDNALACVISQYGANAIYRNRLAGGRFHMLCPPQPRWMAYTGDGEPFLHFRRLMGRNENAEQSMFLYYNRFVGPGNTPASPRMFTIEFPTSYRQFAEEPFGGAYSREAVLGFPRRLVDLWDQGQTGTGSKVSLDGTSEARSPQTEWTSTNLLNNSSFAADGMEVWRWRGINLNLPTVDVDALEFTGRAMEVRWDGPRANIPASAARVPIRLSQVLLPPRQDPQLGQYALFHGNRLVAGCWVHVDVVELVRVGFQLGGFAPISPGPANWRANKWLFVTAYIDVPGFDYPNMRTGELSAEQLGGFGLEFYIELNVSATTPPFVARFGAPQVNLGPELFPVGPTPLTQQARAAMKLARGFQSTELSRVHPGQRQGSSLIGIPSRLEKVFIDAEPAAEKQPSHFQVELLGEKGARPLCAFTVAPGGASEMTKGLSEEPALVPGDLVVTRLVGGPARAVDVYLQTVHSQVV